MSYIDDNKVAARAVALLTIRFVSNRLFSIALFFIGSFSIRLNFDRLCRFGAGRGENEKKARLTERAGREKIKKRRLWSDAPGRRGVLGLNFSEKWARQKAERRWSLRISGNGVYSCLPSRQNSVTDMAKSILADSRQHNRYARMLRICCFAAAAAAAPMANSTSLASSEDSVLCTMAAE